MLFPVLAHAQIFNQNQVITTPYGNNGFVVSTSSSGGAKLGATTTPYFATFFAGTGTINSLFVTTCSGCSTFGTTSISATSPLNWNTTTATLSIQQATSLQNGYLSATDWTLFNNKISSSSLSGQSPVTYSPSTGVIACPTCSTASFSTTSANYWASLGLAFSTTSVNYWKTTQWFNTYPFINNATTSSLTLGGATTTGTLYVMASTTLGTSLSGAGLGACSSANQALTWAGGVFGCTTISSSGSGYPFTPTLNFGQITQATSGLPWFQNAVYASSTLDIGTNSNAILISNNVIKARVGSANQLGINSDVTGGGAGVALFDTSLITVSNKTFTFPNTTGTFCLTSTCVVNGNRDWLMTGSPAYLTPTTTVQSIGVFGTSTIGNGTQKGGLTVSGGSTTTLNAYFASNIGIGTSVPTQALHVEGAGFFADSSASPDPVDGSGKGVRIGFNAASNYGYLFSNETGINTNDLYLGGNPSVGMVIKSTGLVGIGTTTPTHLLTVAGVGLGERIDSSSATFGAGLKLTNQGVDKWAILADASGDNAPSGSFTIFNYLRGADFNISSGGNVGIGSTSPISTLGINGSLYANNKGAFGYSVIGDPQVCSNCGNPSTAQDTLVVGTSTVGASSARGILLTVISNGTGGNLAQGLNSFVAAGALTGNLTITTNGGALRNRYLSINSSTGYNVAMASAQSAGGAVSGTLASSTDVVAFNAENPIITTGNLMTSYYGLDVQGGTVVGTLTNHYGVYVNDLVSGTTRYGVYQAGATDLNYFAGKTGIGTTSPWGKLSINNSTNDTAGQPLFVVASSTATATTTQFVITNAGNVGIGVNAPLTLLTVSKQSTVQAAIAGSIAQFVGQDANPLRLTFDTHNNLNTSGTAFMFRRSRGTSASPSAVAVNDVLGSLNFRGFGTTAYSAGSTGLIAAKAEGTFTDTSMPTALTFDTTPLNSVTAVESMRIAGSGNVGIGTTTPQWLLDIASSVTAQLTLTSSPTSPHWTFNNIFGNLFLATSSPTTFATSTNTNPNTGYIEFPANGGCIGCTDIILSGGINLRNAKYVLATSSGFTASVFTDLYTVPVGRRALVTGYALTNRTAGSVGTRAFIKDSGTYYGYTGTTTVGAGAGSGTNIPMGFDAGESFSLMPDTTTNAANAFVTIIEYDASVPFFSKKIFSPANGTSTLYTAPPGVSALVTLTPNLGNSNNVGVIFYHFSTASLGNKACIVRAGSTALDNTNCTPLLSGTTDNTNQLTFSATTGTMGNPLNSGDSLQYAFSTSQVGTPSMIWTFVYEH